MITFVRKTAVALFGLMVLVGLSSAAQADKRVALVIGNSAYQKVSQLPNPANDAKLIKAGLEDVGFQVTLAESLTREAFLSALKTFRAQADSADWAIVYYAGHGMEVGGVNYLIPVDATLATDRDVGFEAIPLDQVLAAIEGAKTLKMVILDACRNNPFANTMKKSTGAGRDIGRGLTMVEPQQATLVAYAAKAGTIANDGDSSNSPFAQAMARHLAEPGVEVGRFFRLVHDDVLDATGQTQEPFVYGSLPGRQDFYFRPPVGGSTVVANANPNTATGPRDVLPGFAAPADTVATDYQSAERIGTSAAWDLFLNRYQADSTNFYVLLAKEARQKLALLTNPQQTNPNANANTNQTRPSQQLASCAGGLVASVGLATAIVGTQRCMKPKDIFTDCTDGCPELVVVPAGTYSMGADFSDPQRSPNEGPVHSVTIAASFAVGRVEVTRGQFAAFVAASGYPVGATCRVLNSAGSGYVDASGKSFRDPGFRQDDNHPAVCISYDDAKAYVSWLSKKTGKPYRLLSEAEWEYADRAGSTTPYWFGTDTNRACGFANVADQTGKTQFASWQAAPCRDGYVFTAPVGSYSPNPFGLYDMAGNALEWTEDCYHDSYTGAAATSAPWEVTGECKTRTLRGGSWYSLTKNLRSADRDGTTPNRRYSNIGFRVARALTP